MADFSQFFKKRDEESLANKFGLSEEDQLKLQDNLENYDSKAALRKQFDDLRENQAKAAEIASRSPFANKTEEEQLFEEKHLDPMSRGLLQGGGIGGTLKVTTDPATVSKLTGQAQTLFPKLKSMFQVGEHSFPAANTAEALKIKEALQKTGQFKPGKFGDTLRKLD